MLPSLILSAVLIYEWSQDQNESRLLVEALVCLVMGVVCGLFIVKNVAGGEDSSDSDDVSQSVKPQQQDNNQSAIAPASVNQPQQNSTDPGDSPASAGRKAPAGTLEEAIAMMQAGTAAALETSRPDTRTAPPPPVIAAEPIALSAPPAPAAPIALSASAATGTQASADPLALSLSPKQEPAELPAADFDFSFDMAEPSAPAAPLVSPSAASTPVAAPAAVVDALPAGPQFDDLFDALQAAVPVSDSLGKPPSPTPSPARESTPTLKVEIALTGPERSSGGPRESYDSLKVEFAVKGQEQSDSSETRAVVKSLEEKVARMEAVAAKLEAAGRPEVAEKPGEVDEHQAEDDSRPRKMGTRELVRPLPAFQTVPEWLEYANHLEEKNNFDDAIKCYDKITALDAGSFVAWFRKATVLRKKGCYEDALYCMNYALRIDTKNGGALTEKGLCMDLMGRHDQALTWFDKALATDGDFVPALIGKARCLAALGKHKEALPVYDKALRNEPGNTDARKGREDSAAKCPK